MEGKNLNLKSWKKKVLPIAVISSLTVAGLATVLTGTDAAAKKWKQ